MRLSAVKAPLTARSTSIVATYPEIGGRNIEFETTRPSTLDDDYLIRKRFWVGLRSPATNKLK